MKPTVRQCIFWIPRLLGLLFALFISLFALDVFNEGYEFLETLLALLMHLIPTFLILALLAAAWRREWIGAIGFIGLAVVYGIMSRNDFSMSTFLIIGGPLLLTGFLFMLSWVYNPRDPVNGETVRRRRS